MGARVHKKEGTTTDSHSQYFITQLNQYTHCTYMFEDD